MGVLIRSLLYGGCGQLGNRCLVASGHNDRHIRRIKLDFTV
jgi:hypothetical protein